MRLFLDFESFCSFPVDVSLPTLCVLVNDLWQQFTYWRQRVKNCRIRNIFLLSRLDKQMISQTRSPGALWAPTSTWRFTVNYFGFVTMALYVHLTKFVSNQMNWRTDVQGESRSWMHGVTDNSIDLNYMENSRFVLLPLNVFQIWQFHSSHDSYSTTSRPKKCWNAKIHAPKFCKNLQKRVTCPGIPCIVPTCLRPVWAVRFELKSLELDSLLVCQLSTLRVFTSLLFRSQITVRLTLQVLCPNCAPNYKYWGNPDR